jgi:hypothetical protein
MSDDKCPHEVALTAECAKCERDLEEWRQMVGAESVRGQALAVVMARLRAEREESKRKSNVGSPAGRHLGIQDRDATAQEAKIPEAAVMTTELETLRSDLATKTRALAESQAECERLRDEAATCADLIVRNEQERDTLRVRLAETEQLAGIVTGAYEILKQEVELRPGTVGSQLVDGPVGKCAAQKALLDQAEALADQLNEARAQLAAKDAKIERLNSGWNDAIIQRDKIEAYFSQVRSDLGAIMGWHSSTPGKVPSVPGLETQARTIKHLADQAGPEISNLWKMVSAAVGDGWKARMQTGYSPAMALCAEIASLKERLSACESVVEAVRCFCETYEAFADRWSTAAWMQKVRELKAKLPPNGGTRE